MATAVITCFFCSSLPHLPLPIRYPAKKGNRRAVLPGNSDSVVGNMVAEIFFGSDSPQFVMFPDGCNTLPTLFIITGSGVIQELFTEESIQTDTILKTPSISGKPICMTWPVMNWYIQRRVNHLILHHLKPLDMSMDRWSQKIWWNKTYWWTWRNNR